jgi:hypothetical protein
MISGLGQSIAHRRNECGEVEFADSVVDRSGDDLERGTVVSIVSGSMGQAAFIMRA